MALNRPWDESQVHTDPTTGQRLYYDRPGSTPSLEPICAHDTEWDSLPGQYSHPHPLADPAGKYVSFTAAKDGRSDLFVVGA